MIIRTYSELSSLKTFEERFDYLKISGQVGVPTFGHDRYLNQRFYKSVEWDQVRNEVIARDLGLDLGVDGHDIFDTIIVHHMNPMVPDDIKHANGDILDPEFLITTSLQTHNAIHFGNKDLLATLPVERRPGDTKLW